MKHCKKLRPHVGPVIYTMVSLSFQVLAFQALSRGKAVQKQIIFISQLI